jgi:uncharacterized protein with gpF-like domain
VHLLVQERKIVEALKRELPAPKSSIENRPSTALRAGQSKILKDDGLVGRILLEVFHDPKERAAWKVRVATFVRASQEKGLRQALIDAGLTGERLEQTLKRLLSDPRITRAMANSTALIASKIDDRTRQIVRRQLAEGVEAGEDFRGLADRVQSVMGNSRAAAMGTARNAVGGVLSCARHAGAVDAGMTHKYWLHSRGPGERRPAHIAAELEYRSAPIPIAQPFVVNGVSLMYPRDFAAGSPAETVNCQCMQIYTRPGPKELAAGNANRGKVEYA